MFYRNLINLRPSRDTVLSRKSQTNTASQSCYADSENVLWISLIGNNLHENHFIPLYNFTEIY